MFRQIIKIAVTDAKHLASVFRVPTQQAEAKSYIPWHEIPTIGLSSMNVESKKEGKQRIYVAKIKFVADSFPLDHLDRLCFRILTVSKETYLVGDFRPPYCVVETDETFPGRMAESSRKEYTVTWKSLLPLELYR